MKRKKTRQKMHLTWRSLYSLYATYLCVICCDALNLKYIEKHYILLNTFIADEWQRERERKKVGENEIKCTLKWSIIADKRLTLCDLMDWIMLPIKVSIEIARVRDWRPAALHVLPPCRISLLMVAYDYLVVYKVRILLLFDFPNNNNNKNERVKERRSTKRYETKVEMERKKCNENRCTEILIWLNSNLRHGVIRCTHVDLTVLVTQLTRQQL